MTKYDEINELYALGESDELEDEDEGFDFEEPEKEGKDRNYIPFIQLFLCAAALIGLLVLKYTDGARYREVTDWYQNEMSAEIELPSFAVQEGPSSAPDEVSEDEQSQGNEPAALHAV